MVKMNPQGFDQLVKQISDKIERIDQEIRAEHAGQPAAEVAEHARPKFAAAGINLPDSDLVAYSESVERRENFQFNLQF